MIPSAAEGFLTGYGTGCPDGTMNKTPPQETELKVGTAQETVLWLLK